MNQAALELFPNKGTMPVDMQGKARLWSELYAEYYERQNVAFNEADRYWETILLSAFDSIVYW